MNLTWTYWKVYASPAAMDGLVLGLGDLVERVAGAEAHWHFLRYVDHVGPHLRFRASTTPPVADALHGARHELGHPVGVDLYEPEVHKWGQAGVIAAEKVFTASTLLALRSIRDRRNIAGRVIRHTTARLVPDERVRQAVLRTHAAWWLGESGAESGRVDSALTALREKGVPSRPDEDAVPIPLLEEFAARLADAMHDAGPEHPPAYHLHQHVHLTMNRLGLDPRGEAEVALRELVRLEQTGRNAR